MKHKLLYLILFCFCSQLVLARSQIHCSEKTAEHIETNNKLYEFVSKVTCVLNKSKVKADDILVNYLKSIKDDRDFNIKKITENSSASHQKFKLDVVQKFDSGHGKMILEGKIRLGYKKNNFHYGFASESIKAKGNSSYTKRVQENISIAKEGSDYVLNISKQVSVEKPWYAPEFVFVQEVMAGIKSDLDPMVKGHRERMH